MWQSIATLTNLLQLLLKPGVLAAMAKIKLKLSTEWKLVCDTNEFYGIDVNV